MNEKHGRRDAAKEAWWRRQVEAQHRSGLTIRAFCQEQHLSEASFYAWRKELAKREREKSPSTPDMSDSAWPAFAEVSFTQPTTCPPIELVLADSRRVVIPPGFDRTTLQAVLEILETPRC